MRSTLVSAVAVALLVIGSLTQGAGQSRAATGSAYTVSDIGTLDGYGDGRFDELVAVWPAAIANNGAVVANASSGIADGCCDTFTSVQGSWAVAFTVDNAKVNRVGKERDYSLIADLNEQGDFVGYSTKHDRNPADGQATLWRNGDLELLPGLGGDFSFAHGINDAGVIVGTSGLVPGDPSQHAVLWSDGSIFDLGTLGGDKSVAYDINESGVIVGGAIRTAVRYRPAVWQGGVISELPLPDFWVAGEALAVNDSGVIVGGGFREFAESPIRWINGAYEELPGFEERATGAARDINNDGVVVGELYAQKDGFAGFVAVRWDESGLINLNDLIPADSGYLLTRAVSINDSGQILAVATAADGSQHGVILTPVDDTSGTPVPDNSKETASLPDFRKLSVI